MNDRQAIEQLQRGDIGGLAALVQAYQVQATRVAYLITHDLALAEDIVQAAFLRVYERIGQFDRDRPFRPWFLRSVINDATKAAQRERHVSLDRLDGDSELPLIDLLADPQPGPDDTLNQDELRREAEAMTLFDQAHAIFQKIGDRHGLAVCHWHEGLTFAGRGERQRALLLLSAAVAYEQEIGHAGAAEHTAVLARLEAGEELSRALPYPESQRAVGASRDDPG